MPSTKLNKKNKQKNQQTIPSLNKTTKNQQTKHPQRKKKSCLTAVLESRLVLQNH